VVFARVHTIQTPPNEHEAGLRVVLEDLLPWLRESTGFRGFIRFTDPASGKVLGVTLWATEENMRESAEAGEQYGRLITAGVGAEQLAIDQYEVRFFDVQL
jgi:hypothetical protein